MVIHLVLMHQKVRAVCSRNHEAEAGQKYTCECDDDGPRTLKVVTHRLKKIFDVCVLPCVEERNHQTVLCK